VLQFLLRLSERSQLTNANLGGKSIFEIERQGQAAKFQPVKMSMDSTEYRPVECGTNEQVWLAFQLARADSSKRELALLRDLITALQGHDGHYIRFDARTQAFKVADPSFSAPLKALSEDLATVGAIYRGLQSDLAFLRPDCGLVSQ
jgi:hypothetical protein